MRRIEPGKWLPPILALSLWGACYGQDVSRQALRDALDQLETKFSVRFSYMDQAIDSIHIQIGEEFGTDLSQSLRYMEKRAGLQFVMLDDYHISIQVKQSDTKICGYVFDEDSGNPLPDVLVFSESDFTTSDSNGYFLLPASSEYTIVQAKHVSYRDEVASYSKSEECHQIYLTPLVNVLDEIVILNYITKGIDKKESGAILVDAQEAKVLPGLTEPDIFFVLQNLPGIQSINETVTDINIRGGSNDQNLILWDGLRIYQAGHFFGLISAINPYIVGKTTLMKNGTPARLGEGVSGTIMVQTRKEENDHITAHAGSNLLNSNVLLDLPSDKMHLLIASRQSIGGLVRTPTYEQYFDRAFRFSDVINDPNSQVINSDEKFSFNDVSLTADYTPSVTTTIKSGFLAFNNGIAYRESTLTGNEVVSKSSNLDQSTLAGYMSYDQSWSDKFSTNLFLSVMDYNQSSVNFDVLTEQEHVLENEVLETSIRAEGSYYVNKSWDLQAGFQLTETGIRNFRKINLPEFRLLRKEVLRTSSLYLEGNAQIRTRTMLSLGMRTSYFDKLNKFRIEPRLTMLTKLKGPFSLEVLAETKSQTTVQVVDFQTDFLGVENRKWDLVNGENIPLLTSTQVSAGVNFERPFVLVSLEGFLKKVNGVVTASQGFLNQFQYVKTSGSYGARGVELLINPSVGSLDSWITYAYLQSDYSFFDLTPEKFRNNYGILHTMSLGLSYQLRGMQLSSGINYRSGKPFTPPIGIDPGREEILFDTPNSATLDPYFRLDLSAKYAFRLSEKITGNCGVAIWNLTNRDNIINTFSSIGEGENISEVNQNALGFTPNVNFNFSYTP